MTFKIQMDLFSNGNHTLRNIYFELQSIAEVNKIYLKYLNMPVKQYSHFSQTKE